MKLQVVNTCLKILTVVEPELVARIESVNLTSFKPPLVTFEGLELHYYLINTSYEQFTSRFREGDQVHVTFLTSTEPAGYRVFYALLNTSQYCDFAPTRYSNREDLLSSPCLAVSTQMVSKEFVTLASLITDLHPSSTYAEVELRKKLKGLIADPTLTYTVLQ